MSVYLELFLSFFQIGLFSIGGGYAALPLIEEQVVRLHGWLTMTEFADIITIAEMTPGPIALNSATFVGNRVAGPVGGIVSTIGCIVPSCIIVLALAYVYFKYRELRMVKGVLAMLRPAVVAMIASAGLSILILAFFGAEGSIGFSQINWVSIGLFSVCFAVLRIKKPNPIVVMAGAGAAGILLYGFLL